MTDIFLMVALIEEEAVLQLSAHDICYIKFSAWPSFYGQFYQSPDTEQLGPLDYSLGSLT